MFNVTKEYISALKSFGQVSFPCNGNIPEKEDGLALVSIDVKLTIHDEYPVFTFKIKSYKSNFQSDTFLKFVRNVRYMYMYAALPKINK